MGNCQTGRRQHIDRLESKGKNSDEEIVKSHEIWMKGAAATASELYVHTTYLRAFHALYQTCSWAQRQKGLTSRLALRT